MAKNAWLTYDCPFCKQKMHREGLDFLSNSKGHFVRTWYYCQCGYEQMIAVPYRQAITVVEAKKFPPPEQFVYIGRDRLERLRHRLAMLRRHLPVVG